MAAIIFDFDCTIIDNRKYFVEYIAKEAGRWPLTNEELLSLEGLPLMPMARHLGMPLYKLPNLYFKCRSQMDNVINTLKPFKGMPELIHKLHNEGHELFILSSNSVRNIRLFLKHNNLREYFVEVYAGLDPFGKAGMINKLLRENNIRTKDTAMVGDELRDVRAANDVGVRMIAVSWGLCKKEDLHKLKPMVVVDTVDELMNVLEEI